MEGRAGAGGAFGPDPAVMELDDLARDRESQARALDHVVIGRFDPGIALEDAIECGGGDADAVIADAHVGVVVFEFAGDPNLAAGRGILDRVRDQIAHHLVKLVRVAGDRGHIAPEIERELVRRGGRFGELHGGKDHGIQFNRFGLDIRKARLHSFEVENVVDHAFEALGVGIDVVGVLANLGRGEALVANQLAEAADAGQWRAELMTDDRDKIALGLVDGGELRVCLLQHLGGFPALSNVADIDDDSGDGGIGNE